MHLESRLLIPAPVLFESRLPWDSSCNKRYKYICQRVQARKQNHKDLQMLLSTLSSLLSCKMWVFLAHRKEQPLCTLSMQPIICPKLLYSSGCSSASGQSARGDNKQGEEMSPHSKWLGIEPLSLALTLSIFGLYWSVCLSGIVLSMRWGTSGRRALCGLQALSMQPSEFSLVLISHHTSRVSYKRKSHICCVIHIPFWPHPQWSCGPQMVAQEQMWPSW